MDLEALAQLETRLGLKFTDAERLHRALTHRSAAIDDPFKNNERLEFLGDSIIGMVISELLYEHYPGYSEGELAKSKAYIVSEPALAEAAQRIGLDEYVVLSTGEALAGGRRRRSVLSDAFEALMAAIYLDCGFRKVRQVIRRTLKQAVEEAITDEHRRDYKSALQQQTQEYYRAAPLYHIVSEDGKDHEKIFTAHALLHEKLIGTGAGQSKKEAEQAAAKDALDHNSRFRPPSEDSAQPPVIG